MMNKSQPSAWWQAVSLVRESISNHAGQKPAMQGFEPNYLSSEEPLCQHLFFGAIRHLSRIDWILSENIRRTPRAGLQAILRVATFEVIAAGREEGRIPKVIDHAVEQTKTRLSVGESKLVNAVMRRVLETDRRLWANANFSRVSDLSRCFSHPEALVSRWVNNWGTESTRALLEWNQRPPESYFAYRGIDEIDLQGLASTNFPGFFRIQDSEGWQMAKDSISRGYGYIQDPATALAPAAAELKPGLRILDLCSAPGGKAWQMLGSDPEELISVDRSRAQLGVRYEQWVENLQRFPGTIRRIECDLLKDDLREVLPREGIQPSFDRVFIDAPCSNTGVIRRRPEVRWRLEENSFQEMGVLQRRLLEVAAARVQPEGRLIYSTCSLEPEENQQVAQHFSKEHPEFENEISRVYLPWETGHDGAGVFTWKRIG